ncbi:3'-5' exonuclease [Streptomyces sp. NPDC057020]|uniref:3'-5' exonuclease n=1 Tax=unclassified Streptomyces TaxID=2593676 RepID=UPI0036426E55
MANGEDFDLVAEAFEERLAAVIDTHADWRDVFIEFESADAVALLTAHRNKGLEYHVVAFLGIPQEPWWAYGRDRREGTSTFFVGLSRAAQRLIFTTDYNDRSGPSQTFSPCSPKQGYQRPTTVENLPACPQTQGSGNG